MEFDGVDMDLIDCSDDDGEDHDVLELGNEVPAVEDGGGEVVANGIVLLAVNTDVVVV
jgi:hypothetical protein